MAEHEPPTSARRDVVLHPRTASARRLDRVRSSGSRVRGYVGDTDDVLAFVAEQRRLGLQVFLPVVAALLAVLVLSAVTDLGQWQIGSVPVLWLILGPISLFSILGVAVFNERRALRLEADWINEHE